LFAHTNRAVASAACIGTMVLASLALSVPGAVARTASPAASGLSDPAVVAAMNALSGSSERMAATGDIDGLCIAAESVEFTPALTNTVQDVDWKGGGIAPACRTAANPLTEVIGLSTSYTGKTTGACTGLATTTAFHGEVKWVGDPAATVLNGDSFRTFAVGAQIVTIIEGDVTGGKFAGDRFTRVVIRQTTNAAGCAAAGVQGASGPTAYVFTKA